ncbi:hypothetical protein KC352_g50 [Hortaea werneckii]|nr:hypothetical protein KC352_g50 [Hortaea werneckii]
MRNPSRSVHSPRRVSDDAVPICTGTTTDLDTMPVTWTEILGKSFLSRKQFPIADVFKEGCPRRLRDRLKSVSRPAVMGRREKKQSCGGFMISAHAGAETPR